MSKIDKNGNIEISSPSTHLKEGVNNGSFKESRQNSRSYGSTSGAFSSVFYFIIFALFIISYSHYIRTGVFIDFSFKSLIDYLSGVPDVSISFSSVSLVLTADLGAFNFIKYIWNPIASIMEFGLTLSGMGIQMLVVIGYLAGLLFI